MHTLHRILKMKGYTEKKKTVSYLRNNIFCHRSPEGSWKTRYVTFCVEENISCWNRSFRIIIYKLRYSMNFLNGRIKEKKEFGSVVTITGDVQWLFLFFSLFF